MRGLVLMAVLGMAFPAFGAEDAVPMVVEAAAPEAAPDAAPEEGAQTSKLTRGEPAPAAEPERAAEAAPAPPPLSDDAVARATFATAIEQREPADSITSLESDRSRVYYFTELVGASGREVTHRWEYQGKVMAEVPIAICGPRWRAYSSKGLGASQLGEWTVTVIDESGHVLRTDSFEYEAAAPEPEIATAAPASETTMPAPASETTTPGPTPASPAAGEAPDQAPASPAPTQP